MEIRTILLVEDDAVIRRMAEEYLTSKGYRVMAVGSGEEATALSDTDPGTIDILVTDITLPGENGRRVAARLTKSNPSLRVLFMSGYGEDSDILHSAPGEEVDFLQKPFGLDALERKIRGSLERSRTQ